MYIKNVSAKNYRTLENLKIELGSTYNTLSGHNNAGKSCVLNLLIYLMNNFSDNVGFSVRQMNFVYDDDYTQWKKEKEDIELEYNLIFTKLDDPMMMDFISKIAVLSFENKEKINLHIRVTIDQKNKKVVSATIDDTPIKDSTAKEILEKLSSSKSSFLHNSTSDPRDYYYMGGRLRDYYSVEFSSEEQAKIQKAESALERKIQTYAKSHKDELNEMLGKLSQKYDVELSSMDNSSSKRRPLAINLKDKHVKVPLSDWGSGTQNKTRILMSVIQAKKQANENPDYKVTPIMLIEEPESFLHPSAQAEFGRVLESLSSDLGIQIIATTHSPYMLNQINTDNNFLLKRKVYRGKLTNTDVTCPSGSNWMEPFAEHLGVVPPEFEGWKDVFGSSKRNVVLVEGQLDVEYFEFLRTNFNEYMKIPEYVEFLKYDGKDSLKNTTLLKFTLNNFSKSYVTFDLDAELECKKALEKLGLKQDKDFCSIGINEPGKDAIEGLLPKRVLSKVFSENTDIVMKVKSANTSVRKEAKNQLKRLLLQEFKTNTDYTKEELVEYSKVCKKIKSAFHSNS